MRPYLAFLLLLCLTRMLLPEAWVLALHPHAHTTQELAFAKGKRIPGSVLLTTKHTHCQTEQFYQVPFQLAPLLEVPLPRPQLRYQPLAAGTTLPCLATILRRTSLRGPPVG